MGIFKLVVALLLILLNAFFVAAEFAIVKVRQTRIKQLAEEGDRRANVVLTILDHLDENLSATQFGITLASLLLGWIGEEAVAQLLLPPFHWLGQFWSWLDKPAVAHGTATVISLAVITALHIVLGELVPKSLAVTKADAVALACAPPLRTFYRVFYWPIHVLNALANWLLRRFGIDPASEEMAHTYEELRMLVTASAEGGYLDETERDLLDNVFDFSERVAREVMVPRGEMACLYVEDPLAESVAGALAEGHSRYPLCAEDKDHVIGLILLKDLMREQGKATDLREITRPIIVVPEQVSISKLLRLFQQQKGRMAILVDEYGGTAGLITLEDLLEELVGDIQDETDLEEAPEVQQLDAATYEVDGTLLVEEARAEFNWKLPEHEGVDTLGGLVTTLLGELPQAGRELRIAGFAVTVLAVEGYRVSRLRVRRCESPEECG